MRSAWLTGVLLAAGGVLLLLVGEPLDLEITPSVLLGVALGGALATVPAGTDLAKLAAATLGVVAAWIGYLLRALVLPDTTSGAAVALVVVLALCTVPAAVLRDRLPLWAALLGAGALVGTYESAFAAAPSEMATTSVSALSTVLLVVGAGFLLGSVAGGSRPAAPAAPAATVPAPADSLETSS